MKTVAIFQVGDKVLRKSQKGVVVGLVVAIEQNGRLRVRWPMPRWKGGIGSIHSSISPKSVILATTEEIESRHAAIRSRRDRPIWDRFCKKCGRLYKDKYQSDYICPNCKE